jgi:WD40 repeat protein
MFTPDLCFSSTLGLQRALREPDFAASRHTAHVTGRRVRQFADGVPLDEPQPTKINSLVIVVMSGGTTVCVLRAHETEVSSVKFMAPSLLLSGDSKGHVVLWKLTTRRPLVNRPAHARGILSLAANSERIVTHGRDGAVAFWDAATFDDATVRDPLFSIDTDSFTFCAAHWPCDERTAAEWRSVVAAPNAHQSFVSLFDVRQAPQLLCVLTPDGKPGMAMGVRIVSRLGLPYGFAAHEDGCLRMWDLRSAREPLATSDAPPQSAAVDDDEAALLSDALLAARKVSPVATARAFDKTEPATCIDVDALTNGRAFVGGAAQALQTIDIDFARGRLTLATPVPLKQAGLGAVCVRRDARLIATGGWDSKVRIFTARRLRPLAILREHVGSVFALDFGFEPEHLLASGGKDGHVVVHSAFGDTAAAPADAD